MAIKQQELNLKGSDFKNPLSEAKPFLKWVGGKGQLLRSYSEYFPKDGQYNRYFEPFLGGGAVFYSLKPSQAHLNDLNIDLINTYKIVKKDVGGLIRELKKLEKAYIPLSELDREEFYYKKVREEYNKSNNTLKKSAYLIFMNKTGYNGMYRVNASGDYNIPFGKYKNPTILNENNLLRVSELLSGVRLTSLDFIEAVKSAKKGDFVYLDPPYHPLDNAPSFTSYSKDDFGEKDQLRVAELFRDLDNRGCKVMLSNSYTDFIKELYDGYRQDAMEANRSINSKAKGRGKIKELIILNY